MHGAAALGFCLALGGAAGGSVFAASGRLILGWFARHERGLAMGIRQSAQPLGVALAAVTLPALAASGIGVPLRFLGGFCLVAAALVVALVRDPARPKALPAAADGASRRRASPYRQPVLWRIHAASALLVVPQFTVATFALVFLDRRARLGCQPCGPAARDRAAGRGTVPARGRLLVRPGRQPDAADAHPGCQHWRRPARAGCRRGSRIVGCGADSARLRCRAVSTNGLAFTAVAEYAGSAWAGRALGIQNTGQNALAAATPPVLALAIGSIGFGGSFAVVAAFGVVAAALVPVSAERPLPGRRG